MEMNMTLGIWKRISIPFSYSGLATGPAFILLSFYTHKTRGDGSAGDELLIDDLELIYNPIQAEPALSTLSYQVGSTLGTAIAIPFEHIGIFQPGNTFTAELSDANGSFNSPITLGSLNAKIGGTINGTIPAGTPAGNGYKIRITATKPSYTGDASQDDITIIEGTLPLNLIYWSGKRQADGNLLIWETARESGFSHFTVERTINGKGYVPLSSLNGGQRQYSFLDSRPATGTNYYRLKMTDIDHNYRYSQAIPVRFTLPNTVVIVYPNPASSTLYLQSAAGRLLISDVNGKVVQDLSLKTEGTHPIDISKLAKGTYFFHLWERGSQLAYGKFSKD